MIVGLTGGIGCGKSTVAALFKECGAAIMNSDQIVHELLQPTQSTYTKIVQYFGSEILHKDDTINRAHLRTLIFQDPAKRLWLEQCLHPLVKSEIHKQAALISKGNYLLVEIPLLFEASFQDTVQRILIVDCPHQLQIERVVNRDHTTPAAVEMIIATQISREQRLALADDVLDTTLPLNEVRLNVKHLHGYYLGMS